MRKLTDFIFFKDTPLIDFQNTILFESNTDRDNFFLQGNHYPTLTFNDMQFNFIRDRQSIDLPISYDSIQGINYCTFISDFEKSTRYYAYVISYEYLNENSVRLNLLIDGIMTFCQGDTINNFKNLTVYRKHMTRTEYNNRLLELKNNDDIIETHTKRYTDKYQYDFDSFDMLIQSSCSFTMDFGDVDDPKIETSDGLKFDKISSPLNLYVVSQDDFPKLMTALAPYPWISQNIRSVSMIPSILIEGKTVDVSMESGNFKNLKMLIDGGNTNRNKFDTDLLDISKTINNLYDIFNLDSEEDKHLLRSEYTTTEVYTWDGHQLFIDNGQLSEKYGLFFRSVYVSGFHNEVGIYIENYKSANDVEGSFLNDAIFFRNFDDIPIMIDNYNLSLSKSANQRQLAESRLVTNRISNIVSGDDTRDRFYDATSLLTNFNPITLFGKFNDEHEFYKNQQAEFADLALQTPTISSQTNNNSLAIAEDFFGIHVKHAQPIRSEWNKIKKYYKMFGFEVNDENSTINVRTNTICDYAQFSGNFIIPNADVSIVEMMKAQFENGVRFWHNNNTRNPMERNVLDNKMR